MISNMSSFAPKVMTAGNRPPASRDARSASAATASASAGPGPGRHADSFAEQLGIDRGSEKEQTRVESHSSAKPEARRKVKVQSGDALDPRGSNVSATSTAVATSTASVRPVASQPIERSVDRQNTGSESEIEGGTDQDGDMVAVDAVNAGGDPNLSAPIRNLNPQSVVAEGEGQNVSELQRNLMTPMRDVAARSEIAESRVGAPDDLRQQPSQAHRRALEGFMANMKKEFGIEPERIVDAFQKMDEKTLMAPPEESTKSFLNNLQLPAQQQARAGDLYKQMVRSTGDAALNEKLSGVEQGVRVDVLSPRDQALHELNQAIDQLNDVFAMRGQKPVPMSGLEAAGPTAEDTLRAQLAAEQMGAKLRQLRQATDDLSGIDGQQASDQNDVEGANGLMASNLGARDFEMAALAKQGAAGADVAADGAPGVGPMTSALPSTQADLQAQSQVALQPVAQQMSGGSRFESGEGMAKAGRTMRTKSVSASGNTASTATDTRANLASQMRRADVKAASTPSFGGDAAAVDPQAIAPSTAAPVQSRAMGTGPAGMILERPVATAQDEQDNVKELIRQAQVVVKKGGGEIKMDLKPEGIGQVHLKVNVDGGQVSVQMLTQNDEAKRVLEKGLHELKSSLAAHQLKVENLKVDVGTDVQKHMDKGPDDQGREQTRQFANDVMAQMRDERQALQQDFMENRGWRQYPRGGEQDMARRSAVVAAAQARQGDSSKKSSSSRLDLVA